MTSTDRRLLAVALLTHNAFNKREQRRGDIRESVGYVVQHDRGLVS
jgi:hypothetical protein